MNARDLIILRSKIASPAAQPTDLIRSSARVSPTVAQPTDLIRIRPDDMGEAWQPVGVANVDKPVGFGAPQTDLIRLGAEIGYGVAYARERWAPGTIVAGGGWNPFKKKKHASREQRMEAAQKRLEAAQAEIETKKAEAAARAAEQTSKGPVEPDTSADAGPSPEGSDASGAVYGRGLFYAKLAAACSAGNLRACKILARLKVKNPRAYHAVRQIQANGLSGCAGDITGFVPLAAWAAEKYGPNAARYAVRNKGKVAKASHLVSKANAGDPKAKRQIAIINAGAKTGDPEAIEAKKAVKLASEHAAYGKRYGWITIRQD